MNILELQSTTGSIVWKSTHVNVTDQGMNQPSSNAVPAQEHPVALVSFLSTTQVRMDTAVPPPVSQVQPQVPPVWVSLSQITSVASTSNEAPSLMSHQTEMRDTNQNQQGTEAQCRKCAKRNHPTT